ncbi:AmmeMemoRadiSam system radical SAM enzyme [candidate division KSB3 bacterium]|uniref:AmmeMemoRadiSam system radical SAM enzyme n=1 Tax=candidate division KSB3 bacterium TaxID=2044937 RepID=A0A2G6E417_9BACT|nr:MAG: AmmeMemoRadiSam system radical SAM enzyme [candidate division KSB3 bacterium]PIE29406.1 MAG: AmmeMemoRadiSam system radical SAM enzyme [candidate division KSB3 bacterium]
MLYRSSGAATLSCFLCSHRCAIRPGGVGLCGVRTHQDGRLYTLVYDKVIAAHVDPIEKKPLHHFLPGSFSFSVATVGCNFHCFHCQNHDIAQIPKTRGTASSLPGHPVSPEDIVNSAARNGCKSIAYTYTEPTIYFELAYDTARLAHERGIKNVFVTNGYMTEEALETIQPYLDAANVDLKGYCDSTYRTVCGGRLEPVKESIQRMVQLGIWVEVTTLVIPMHNESETELREIAKFLKGVSPEIPWHVSAFHPHYKFTHLPATSSASIARAVVLGKEAGLKYVYSGNIFEKRSTNTYCPSCGKLLIHRSGFHLLENQLMDGKCPLCSTKIGGIFS